MKIGEIIGEASNPTDFETFRRNALATFPVVNKGNEREMAPAFRVVLKKDPDRRSTAIKFEQGESRDIQEKVEIQAFLEDLQEEDPDKYGDLTLKDLEIEYISVNRPNFKDGELQGNDVDTPIQQVLKHVAEIKDDEKVTVNNIRQIVKDSTSQESKGVYFDRFLTTLIDNKDQPFRPFTVIDSVTALKRAGFKNESEILTEFGEVAGPVGLLSRSISGSATRMLGTFLGKNGSEPSTEDLQSKATIHFHPSKTHELVDSYIEYEGQVLRVSSKNAGKNLSGGSGASLDGLFSSIEEIIANPNAKRRFEELLRQDSYLKAYDVLRLLSKNFTKSEIDQGMAGYVATFKLINELSKEEIITDKDIAILKNLWTDSSGKDIRMHNYRDEIGASLGNQPDIDAVGMMGQFSDGLKSLFTNMIDGSSYGEPSTSGSERIGSNNDIKGWWARLKKAAVYKLATMINSIPEFSNLCTFILNHGAFCQIDLRWSEEKTGGKNGIKITNITATWPSTAVDSVKILPLSRGGIKFKLAINDKNATPDSEYLNDLDYDFGYKKNSDLANKMMPTAADLFGTKERDESNPDGRERASSSPTAERINNFFKGLANNKIIPSKSLPKTPEERAEVSTNLALKIVGGYTPEALVKSIRYGINDIYSAVRKFGINEARDDDEDEDEDDEESDGTSSVNSEKQAISIRDVQEYKNLLDMMYNSLRVNEYLKDNSGDKSDQMVYQGLIQTLQNSVSKVDRTAWPRFEEVLEPRSRGVEPEYNTDAMKRVIRKKYKPALSHFEELLPFDKRNYDGVVELAKRIANGDEIDSSIIQKLSAMVNDPAIQELFKDEDLINESITKLGQRELDNNKVVGSLYILKRALDVRNSPPGEDKNELRSELESAIVDVFRGKKYDDYREIRSKGDSAVAAVKRAADEKEALAIVMNDRSKDAAEIRKFIDSLQVKEYEKYMVPGATNGIQKWREKLVPDTETQGEAAAYYLDIKDTVEDVLGAMKAKFDPETLAKARDKAKAAAAKELADREAERKSKESDGSKKTQSSRVSRIDKSKESFDLVDATGKKIRGSQPVSIDQIDGVNYFKYAGNDGKTKAISASDLPRAPVSKVIYGKYQNAREKIDYLRSSLNRSGQDQLKKDFWSMTLAQFEEKYFNPKPVVKHEPELSPEEQRIQRIIAMAQADGRAKNVDLAKKEILDFGLDNSDEELSSVLQERRSPGRRSSILRGILG